MRKAGGPEGAAALAGSLGSVSSNPDHTPSNQESNDRNSAYVCLFRTKALFK